MKSNDSSFFRIAAPVLSHPQMKRSKGFIQHGNVSVFDHSLSVAKCCDRLNRRFRLGCNRERLIRGALLHDFFLYDWHDPGNSLHGFTHPAVAAKNAKKYFNIDRCEFEMITSHMWPLTITKIPKSREGWLLCAADKYCSLKETLMIG